MAKSNDPICLRRRLVVVGLLVVMACLILISLVDVVTGPQEGWASLAMDRLRLDSERSVAALFAFVLLVIAAGLLGLIGLDKMAKGDPWRYHWCALALIFVVLAYDEAAVLHEAAMFALRERFDLSGIFYFAWVIPGSFAVIVFGLAFLRFLLHLRRPYDLLFAASGILYVGGALGMEMVGGPLYEDRLDHYGIYYGITVIEETLEMVGIILFIDTLLRYLEDRGGEAGFRLRIDGA